MKINETESWYIRGLYKNVVLLVYVVLSNRFWPVLSSCCEQCGKSVLAVCQYQCIITLLMLVFELSLCCIAYISPLLGAGASQLCR